MRMCSYAHQEKFQDTIAKKIYICQSNFQIMQYELKIVIKLLKWYSNLRNFIQVLSNFLQKHTKKIHKYKQILC